MKPGSREHEISYEKWLNKSAEDAFNANPVCPWCGCESADEDVCDECGLNMEGTPFWECPYCGKEKQEGDTCCGENHVELRVPPCPKCCSKHTHVVSVSAENSGAVGCDTTYLVCEDCDHQWNHQ